MTYQEPTQPTEASDGREQKAMEIAIAKCSKTAGMLNNEMIKAVMESVLEGMNSQAERCANRAASIMNVNSFGQDLMHTAGMEDV